MASPAVDLGSLSAEQQATLQQYTAVTNQEIEAAVPLLQRCEWNAQVTSSPISTGVLTSLTPGVDSNRSLL